MNTTTPLTYWQKQILPEGSYTVGDFTPQRLSRVVEMFDPAQGVPFILSDVKDTTKRSAGTLTGLTHYPGEGIWGNFQLTDEVAAHVTTYPRFGTTATVSQDGRITAVQGTNTPQIPGMAGWERINVDADPQEHDLSEEQLNNEGDRKMSLNANNLDPDLHLRLEQFVQKYCGISMTGQSAQNTIDLAMELAVGREHAFAEALAGQEIIQKGLATNDEMHAWLDANGL